MSRGWRSDLPGWEDDPIVRALRAQGTPEELEGLAPVLNAFRAQARRRRARAAGRIGAGVTTVVAAVAFSGGVAAAYIDTLPAPLQSVAHTVLGPVGVPPAGTVSARAGTSTDVHHHHHTGRTGDSSAEASPTPAASAAAATARPAGGDTTGRPRSPAPTTRATAASTSPTPTASPSPSPSAQTPQARRRALRSTGLSVTPARTRVPAGQRAVLHGTVPAPSGQRAVRQKVYLEERPAGSQSWHRTAAGEPAGDGSVTLESSSLTRDVSVRLVSAQGQRSAPRLIHVVPQVVVSVARAADPRYYVVTVTVAGAEPGDTVTLTRRSGAAGSEVGRVQLGDKPTVTFRVPVPTSPVRYHVDVARSPLHAAGVGRFTARAG